MPILSLLAPDLCTAVLNHVTSLASLGRMCQICKAFRDALLSPSARDAWLQAGREFCGDEHWPPVDESLPRHNDPRYVTMIRCFPWISNGSYCHVDVTRAIWALGGRCNVMGIDRLNDFTALKLLVKGMQPHPILQHMTQFVFVGVDPQHFVLLHHFETVQTRCRDEFRTYTPSDWERQMLSRLKQEWHDFPLVNQSIQAVRKVHRGLMCVFSHKAAAPYDFVDVYFVSTHTLAVMFSIRQRTRVESVSHCFAFAPGEIWASFDDHRLVYFGPHKDWRRIDHAPPVRQAMWAAFKGDTATAIDRLLRNGVEIPALRAGEDIGLLDMAVESGSAEAVDHLLRRFPQCAAQSQTGLSRAIRMQRADIVERLLDSKADATSQALCAAATHGPASVFRLLLDRGASACTECLLQSVTPDTPVDGVLDWILNQAPRVEGPPLIHWLQGGGDLSRHILAAQSHLEVNLANERGETPLMYAAATLVPANVQALLQCGADPSCRDAEGRSAAEWCPDFGRPEAELIWQILKA